MAQQRRAFAAALFDLDNTLYPASSGVQQALDLRMQAYVCRVVGCDDEQARLLRRGWFARYGTTLAGLQAEHAVDVEHYLADIHDVDLAELLRPSAELDALLTRLRLPRAIFTNSPVEHARRVLRTLALEHHFDVILDLRSFGFRPKPDPHAYACALEALGAAASATILVEDTLQNLPPARALGMTTILIDERGDHADTPADYCVPDVRSALQLMLELGA